MRQLNYRLVGQVATLLTYSAVTLMPMVLIMKLIQILATRT